MHSVQDVPAIDDGFPAHGFPNERPVEPFVFLPFGSQKQRVRAFERRVSVWPAIDFGDENLLRQDWLTGETLFLRGLAFRTIEADFPG